MASPLAKCTSTHKKARFVVREKRSEVSFENPRPHIIGETKVDKCAITSGPRCDYLVTVEGIQTSVFVELKGGDVPYAVKQLEASHKQLSQHTKRSVVWIVSSTRCPLTSTEIQVLALQVRRRLGARLIVKNTPVRFTIPSS